ncbi:MAG: GLPGLI family protein [Flavobacteriaceae bacterium]|jgi:GLPGLI family protein|nr:GLPGLI family protein [Flavobacteriaceae bacterium]
MTFINIFFILSFIPQTTFSQTNIEVEYKVIVDAEDSYIIKLSETGYLKSLIGDEIEKIDDYRFRLLINDSISSFYLSKESENQKSTFTENSAKFIFSANYSGAVYNANQSFYTFDSNMKVFSTDNHAFEWEILNETKEIDGFTAYKAKTVITIKNPAGYFNFPVVAWYCPQLPYNTGPMGYGGLPGMILEIRIRNATFIAEKIEFNTEDEIDVEFFKKHKKIELEELNKRIEEEMQMLKE